MTIPPNIAFAAASFKSTGSTTSRTHADRAADTVNVRDFGAQGDGVTDDRVAIQLAIDAAFGGVTNLSTGVTVGSHGYANRKANRKLYFPPSSGDNYYTTDSVYLNHIYGGYIFGDNTGLVVLAPGYSTTAPAIIVNGMVETTIENINLFSHSASPCNMELDWDGDWDDLPVADTNGLRHNVFNHMSMGTAGMGMRIANSGHDGSFNSFINTLVAASHVGIEAVGTGALGNMVYGGGCSLGNTIHWTNSTGYGSGAAVMDNDRPYEIYLANTSHTSSNIATAPTFTAERALFPTRWSGIGQFATVGYKATGGQFSIVHGLGNGGTDISLQINSNYPTLMIGGRIESTYMPCIDMTTGKLIVQGFDFDSSWRVINITGGQAIFDACQWNTGSKLVGTAPGLLYFRGSAPGDMTGFPPGQIMQGPF